MTQDASAERRRFGIVAADPLRLLGLRTIFPEETGTDIVPLQGAVTPTVKSLKLIIIDATCTALLFELMAAFLKVQPSVRLLVVGLDSSFSYIERVIGAGARGYLTHGASESEVRMAVDIVLDGSVWAPRKVLARLLDRGQLEQRKRLTQPQLTPREKDVLRRLVTGFSNKEIAADLAIDSSSVKAHVGRLMRKVGVSNRTALSVETTRLQLLSDESLTSLVETERGDADGGL